MKKSLIAASASAVALAAMPVVGVFAETTRITSHEDEITLTVDKGCAFADTDTKDTAAFGTMTPGSYDSRTTDGFTITCNGPWTLSAVGGNVASESSALLNGTNRIESANGTTDGKSSNWAFSLAGTGSSYTDPSKVPATITSVATGASGVNASQFTPTYYVSVGIGQAQGQYTGTVTYSVAAN